MWALSLGSTRRSLRMELSSPRGYRWGSKHISFGALLTLSAVPPWTWLAFGSRLLASAPIYGRPLAGARMSRTIRLGGANLRLWRIPCLLAQRRVRLFLG